MILFREHTPYGGHRTIWSRSTIVSLGSFPLFQLTAGPAPSVWPTIKHPPVSGTSCSPDIASSIQTLNREFLPCTSHCCPGVSFMFALPQAERGQLYFLSILCSPPKSGWSARRRVKPTYRGGSSNYADAPVPGIH